MLVNNALTPGNHQKGRGLFIDVALVLKRPFQPRTILFRWMKIETTQLLFVQSMLNRLSDLSGRIKLAKIGLFIYSKVEPKPQGRLNLDQTGMCHRRLKFTTLFWSGKSQKVYPVLKPRALIIYPVLELPLLL